MLSSENLQGGTAAEASAAAVAVSNVSSSYKDPELQRAHNWDSWGVLCAADVGWLISCVGPVTYWQNTFDSEVPHSTLKACAHIMSAAGASQTIQAHSQLPAVCNPLTLSMQTLPGFTAAAACNCHCTMAAAQQVCALLCPAVPLLRPCCAPTVPILCPCCALLCPYCAPAMPAVPLMHPCCALLCLAVPRTVPVHGLGVYPGCVCCWCQGALQDEWDSIRGVVHVLEGGGAA
jgi:hypothetical protein